MPRACSEADCLNLNVETTGYQKEDGKPLKPVMVFIHGGAFYMVRWGWVGNWGKRGLYG